MTPGLSQHAPDVDTSGSQRQSREPGNAAVGPGTPGKMPSRRRSCAGTRGPASSDSQRSNAPSLGSEGGPSPLIQQWVRRSWGGLSARFAPAASGEFGEGGYRAAVSSAAGYTPEGGSRRAGSPAYRGVEEGEKRGEEGGTWPRPAVGRAAQAPGLAGPRGCGRLRDPRPPRPRSVPPPSPVPKRPAVPRFSRRTRTGQARDSGSWAGGAGRAGAGGGVLSHRPAPRRPAPCKPGPAPARGLARNNLLEAAAERPQLPTGSPGSRPALVSAGTPLPRQGSGPGLPFPNEDLSSGNRPQTDGRAPDTQLLR